MSIRIRFSRHKSERERVLRDAKRAFPNRAEFITMELSPVRSRRYIIWLGNVPFGISSLSWSHALLDALKRDARWELDRCLFLATSGSRRWRRPQPGISPFSRA